MPPKQRFSSSHAAATTSSHVALSETHPWPRIEGMAFSLPDASIPIQSDDRWDQQMAYYYNQMLRVKLEPTRTMCIETLQGLGIYDEVSHILNRAHCLTFALEEDVLFPDLTRQCLASAKLTYKHPERPKFEEATFSYFADGVKHTITMEDFCIVFGFHHEVKELNFPKKFKESAAFWDTIASGPYRSNSASQTKIRHPAIRICARIFSNMLFNRESGNKVHLDELLMLFLGCTGATGDGEHDEFNKYRANLGIRFAEIVCAIKDNSTGTTAPRTERIGSLLTSLFRHHRVDLTAASCNERMEKMDTNHLISSKILRDPTTYRFTSRMGAQRIVELPNRDLTQLLSPEDLSFHEPPNGSHAGPSNPPPHQADVDDEPPVSPPMRLTYPTTAADQGEFDLPPISNDPDTTEYRRWMIASQKKNNSLMQRIMQALSRGCCHNAADTQQQQPQPQARASTSSSSDASSHSDSSTLQRRKKRKAPGSATATSSRR